MRGLINWLAERYQIDQLLSFAKKKDVPIHKEFVWYYFGGIALFLFIIQVFTGILLLLYYKPGADTAFESVQFIVTKVKYGWLIRSIHSWSANLMVLAAFIHMFSNLFARTYRKPRELTWISGMFLFFLSMGFGFSGYLLPWNELAFFATKVGTDIAGAVPIIGEYMLVFLRGGQDVTGGTLSRFFGFHVAVLPGIFTLFLAAHLAIIQFQGMSTPLHLEGKIKRKMPFFPNFMLRDLVVWIGVLNVVALLAVFFPWELGVKADAFQAAPAGIKPEWYFMFMFQTLKFLPAEVFFIEGELVGIGGFSLAGILVVLLPFIDRKSSRGIKHPLVTILGVLAVLFIIAMTIVGYTIE
ncbi:cytochrome bc complex cytochrome b subunit [candidate division LCP-89 bacterium B3_LCP]|uniref:Cytochrome bc complex cytochrome b subunit n=1 Tax=candidate division LCP-89 bacterium B3_LCP TaxID=2012998 RepID=A0A532USQ6_UNCL8|nr:MAG: cytochrome bc complex cytochrome b subunit [candidate division LCP-89 bacterium B3_LCP]